MEKEPARRRGRRPKKENTKLAAVVPPSIREDPSVPPVQKLIAGVIYHRGGTTDLSNGELSELLSVHSETIRRHLVEMEKAGILERTVKGPARSLHLKIIGSGEGKVFVPAKLLEDENLTATKKYLLARLFGLSQNDRGSCYAKNSTLAYEQGISGQGISNQIYNLKKAGLVEVDQNGRRRIIPTDEAVSYFHEPPTNPEKKKEYKKEKQNKGKTSEQRGSQHVNRRNPYPKNRRFNQISAIIEKLEADFNEPQAVVIATVGKAEMLSEMTGVVLDRHHLIELVFTGKEQVKKASLAYRRMDVKKPAAALFTLLRKARNDELNYTRDVSPRAESLALSKQRNLQQNQQISEPDSYMAHLFDTDPSTANRAYSAALDVVLNGNARNPLKLFTHYAKKLKQGEEISTGTNQQDKQESNYHGRAI